MVVLKRRLIIWLIRAYIKRWGKFIILYFFLGLAAFFLLLMFVSYILPRLPIARHDTIGVVGAYRLESIPEFILQDVSSGLTIVDENGKVKPGLAASWGIQDNGKRYVFRLKKGLTFSDGTPLTSRDISLTFKDVKITRPNDQTIVYELKDSYAPFLVAISRPVFKKDFVGVGEYKITAIKVNGGFVQSMKLVSIKNNAVVKSYQFYPGSDAVKIAFALGEISKAIGLDTLHFQHTSLEKFPNAAITRSTDYSELVTLFYNTADKNLSDKKLRDALSYTLPDTFLYGERALSPLSVTSWAYQPDDQHKQDIAHAKLLLEASDFDTKQTITISAHPKYKKVAEEIIRGWNKIGVKGTVVIAERPPANFQTYLTNFHVSKDPDQYTLWHSDQVNNITNYKNLRIDKLLEDGRKTTDEDKRLRIYANFQKYLLDDQPAAFLYFPYTYTVGRK